MDNERDYSVSSVLYDGTYEYLFNVCRELVFSDEVCPEGTGSCERNANKPNAGTQRYGTFSSMEFKEDTTGDWVEDSNAHYLDLTSTAVCSHGDREFYSSRVYLTCSDYDSPVARVIDESYYHCRVILQLKGAGACQVAAGTDTEAQDYGLWTTVAFAGTVYIYFATGAMYVLHMVAALLFCEYSAHMHGRVKCCGIPGYNALAHV